MAKQTTRLRVAYVAFSTQEGPFSSVYVYFHSDLDRNQAPKPFPSLPNSLWIPASPTQTRPRTPRTGPRPRLTHLGQRSHTPRVRRDLPILPGIPKAAQPAGPTCPVSSYRINSKPICSLNISSRPASSSKLVLHRQVRLHQAIGHVIIVGHAMNSCHVINIDYVINIGHMYEQE